MTSPEQEALRLIAKIALDAHNAALPDEHEARLRLHRALERMGKQDYTEREMGRAVETLNAP
jgi:hypothetical protein